MRWTLVAKIYIMIQQHNPIPFSAERTSRLAVIRSY